MAIKDIKVLETIKEGKTIYPEVSGGARYSRSTLRGVRQRRQGNFAQEKEDHGERDFLRGGGGCLERGGGAVEGGKGGAA